MTRTANHPNPIARRRVAFLGAGYIADWHARAIRSVSGVDLVAICDRLQPRARALAAKFGVSCVYGSLNEMLAAEKLDAVHILLPPEQHFEAARAVLNAGVGVFIEKPMCVSAAECAQLTQLASERGLPLGVGHNFLFAPPYERLRAAMRAGVFGPLRELTINWHRPLPQLLHGPFDAWMLGEPGNILFEIGAHSAAHLLDLVGEPGQLRVHPSDPVLLPTGCRFYCRWQVEAAKGNTAIQLNFSFAPGFSEYAIHLRGALASATVDFERNTSVLHCHAPADQDFDNFKMVRRQARVLLRQARRTLGKYLLSKLGLCARGNPYGESIARAMDGFYNSAAGVIDRRASGEFGANVIRLCEQMAAEAALPKDQPPAPIEVSNAPAPKMLVLGGAGFIGRELVRQLVASGQPVRLLLRSAASLPVTLRGPLVQPHVGDLLNRDDLRQAMRGIEYVFHLARANVKSWADYQRLEIDATRQVAECALEAGVKRLIYTGTIDSYYAGNSGGTITESTPLDPRIARRNLYARAKAESELLLAGMHRELGLPLVIIRPGIVIGRGGSPFHWGVGMWWSNAVCQMWGDGKNKLPLVLVEDVAAGLVVAMTAPGIEGRSFNLVADPSLSARQYLDGLDRSGQMRIQRHATPILCFYLNDMLKWAVKVAVRFPERRLPSYRDWQSRTQRALFDCSAAKSVLGWRPSSDPATMVQRGIEEPLREFLR